MAQQIKIGYFAHWFQPPYTFTEFLNEQGVEITKIDVSQRGYLEDYDVAIVEQNGFNDYVENDEHYIHDWVKRGGILFFMHQDYERWAPYFLPQEVGYTQLIHRHINTINLCTPDQTFDDDKSSYKNYMMPWIEECGRRLFSEPEVITPDEMFDWRIAANSFGILRPHNIKNAAGEEMAGHQIVRTAAQSCYLLPKNWEVIGTYMDPAVRDGALIARAQYGKGMFFLNQLLFPEVKNDLAERSFAFWKKYIKNLLAYFARFKNGESEVLPPKAPQTLALKKNYKMPIHMHSLDWYGCDCAPGTANALMRYMGWDICALAVKDNAPYDGKLDTAKYSDDKVLFLDGQEYHPFNWNDRFEHLSHNTYHMLAIGIDSDAYTPRFTKSLFSDAEVAAYLKESVDYVHEHGGAICATHPYFDYWLNYDVDGVDKEPLIPLGGTDMEKAWLAGKRFAAMVSVDFFGMRRAFDNPAVNFLYLGGEVPCRDNVVRAVREGHTIAAVGFDEVDITLNGYVPGDEVPVAEAQNGVLSISAKAMKGEPVCTVRVYSGANVIYRKNFDENEIAFELPLKDFELNQYIRVEVQGITKHWICTSTPFYLK